jgi:hypothetical protein
VSGHGVQHRRRLPGVPNLDQVVDAGAYLERNA